MHKFFFSVFICLLSLILVKTRSDVQNGRSVRGLEHPLLFIYWVFFFFFLKDQTSGAALLKRSRSVVRLAAYLPVVAQRGARVFWLRRSAEIMLFLLCTVAGWLHYNVGLEEPGGWCHCLVKGQ